MQLYNRTQELKPRALDREMIEIALEKVQGGEETERFFWKWDGDLLLIQEQGCSSASRGSWVALGCLLTSVEIAGRAQGWFIDTELLETVGALISFLPAQRTLQGAVKLEILLKKERCPIRLLPSFFSMALRMPGMHKALGKVFSCVLKGMQVRLVMPVDSSPHALVRAGQIALRSWVEQI